MTVKAQDIKRPESYNYTRAVEAIQQENYQEALDFLNMEIEENPKNGYAFAWIAAIRQHYQEYGRAITALDQALKYIPKKDKTYRTWVYSNKADVYQELDEYDKALECISLAIAADPTDKSSFEKRAQLLFEQEKYAQADLDYQKMIELAPGDVMGYMGLGRNQKMQNNYDAAIEQFNYAIKLSPDYASGYSFRGECYLLQGKYNEAATDIVRALEINYDNKAFYHMQQLADSSITAIATKLRVQAAKEPNENTWPYYLGVVHERKDNYKKAISYYKDALKLETNPIIANRISSCYEDLGNYSEALRYINMAIQADSTNEDFLRIRALIYDATGNTQESIGDWDKYISMDPEYYYGYYRRGWVKDHTGDAEGAIEDYTTSIELEPRYSYAYINRGVLYKLIGEKELAKKDFEEVIARDTLLEESHTIYALFHLGKVQEAKDLIQKLLSKNEDASNCYEAACLYSLADETETSLEFLRKALEKGNRKFNHIKRDRDLTNLRATSGYTELIEEFEEKWQKELSSDQFDLTIEGEEKTVEIPFSKDGGVCKVRCQINGLPLHFIFDTGASDVSISSVEATFMLKNDYLKPSDIIGKQNYINANGDITEGTVINLRKVNFGGLELTNIKASVVKNQSAPLLLGQSVLSRLGRIEIDNNAKVLKVTYREKK
jgi:clan AA aspartic protease (TIGR02281 family)